MLVCTETEQDASFCSQHERYLEGIKAFADSHRDEMLSLNPGCEPKQLIELWGAELLETLKQNDCIVDPYNAYQLLMEYWNEALQDDCYIISRDGWHTDLHVSLVQKVNKKAKTVTFEPKKNPTYADYESDLLPVSVVVNQYFAADEARLFELQANLEELQGQIEELESEEGYEDTKPYKDAKKQEKQLKADIKAALKRLTDEVVAKYAVLKEDEVRHLVVEQKWLATIQSRMEGEMARVSQEMTTQVLALHQRYSHTLPDIERQAAEAEANVKEYLKQMGF